MTENQISVADRLLSKLVECGGFMHKDTSIYEYPETHTMPAENIKSMAHLVPYFIQELKLITMMYDNEYFCLTPLGYYAYRVGFAVFFDQMKHASAIDFINKQESIRTAQTTRKHMRISYIFSITALIVSVINAIATIYLK